MPTSSKKPKGGPLTGNGVLLSVATFLMLLGAIVRNLEGLLQKTESLGSEMIALSKPSLPSGHITFDRNDFKIVGNGEPGYLYFRIDAGVPFPERISDPRNYKILLSVKSDDPRIHAVSEKIDEYGFGLALLADENTGNRLPTSGATVYWSVVRE